jgi:hypothetical protein
MPTDPEPFYEIGADAEIAPNVTLGYRYPRLQVPDPDRREGAHPQRHGDIR